MAASVGFLRIPKCMFKWISDSSAFSWAFFLLFVCLVQLQCVSFLFYQIILCSILLYSLRSLFSNETEMGWIWLGGEVGRNWESGRKENHNQDIFYVRKESICNKRKKI